MVTARSRRGRTPAGTKPGGVVAALQCVWAAVLSLAFIVAGLAMAFGGLLFAIVGAQAVLAPGDAGHVVAGVLFAVLGLAAVVGGIVIVFRLRSRAVLKLSGRKPPSLSGKSGGYFGGGFFSDGGGGCGGGGSC